IELRQGRLRVHNEHSWPAGAIAGSMKQPGRDVGRDAQLSGFEVHDPDPPGPVALLLHDPVQFLLRRIKDERLQRPHLRPQLECMPGKIVEIGLQPLPMRGVCRSVLERATYFGENVVEHFRAPSLALNTRAIGLAGDIVALTGFELHLFAAHCCLSFDSSSRITEASIEIRQASVASDCYLLAPSYYYRCRFSRKVKRPPGNHFRAIPPGSFRGDGER